MKAILNYLVRLFLFSAMVLLIAYGLPIVAAVLGVY